MSELPEDIIETVREQHDGRRFTEILGVLESLGDSGVSEDDLRVIGRDLASVRQMDDFKHHVTAACVAVLNKPVPQVRTMAGIADPFDRVPIEEKDVLPATYTANSSLDIAELHDTLATLHESGVEADKLKHVGREIAIYVDQAGLTPSAATGRAVERAFDGSLADKGELLGITKQGFRSIALDGRQSLHAADRANLTTDYDDFILESFIPDLPVRHDDAGREVGHEVYRVHPHPSAPEPLPAYLLIEQRMRTDPGYDPEDPVTDREYRSSPRQRDRLWFHTEEELRNYLYAERTFEREEDAKMWRDCLEEAGLDVEVEPHHVTESEEDT